MFENVIKGGIKPGMVLATDDATKLHTCELWIVFPDKNNNLCAVRYGAAAWTSLRQEADKLYVGRYQCTSIYEPPISSIGTYNSLIWNDERGIVKSEYKPNSSLDDSLDDLLASLDLDDKSSSTKDSEETPTQYFY